MRMRPRAPPLRFWKSRASTTCSRVTLPILVSTRPIGRPLSSAMLSAGAAASPPAAGLAPAPGEAVLAPGGRAPAGGAGRVPEAAVPGRVAPLPPCPAGRADGAPGAPGLAVTGAAEAG